MELLREHIRYEEATGLLFWRKPYKGRNLARPFGSKCVLPYLQFGFQQRILLVHRAVFAIHHGYWPGEVDHIDGNTHNNRIENLRAVTRALNTVNRKKLISNNTSGYTGVSFSKACGKWQARVKFNGREINRICESFEEAVETRKTWVKQHFGESYNEHLQY